MNFHGYSERGRIPRRRGTTERYGAGKVRPVVVVQTNLLNGIHPSTVIGPLTSNVEAAVRFLRVHLAAGEAGLKKKSDILVDQMRTIDNRRLLRKLGKMSCKSQVRLAANITILLT